MSQAPPQKQFSPPWFLLIGLVAGAAFLVFMMADSIPFFKSKVAHSKYVIELTSENWEKEVVKSEIPVIVDFWAPWCGPCLKLAPTIDKLAERYDGKVKFGKVNTDEQKKLANNFKISQLPSIVVFNRGEPLGMLGPMSEEEYVTIIERELFKK